MVSIMKDASKGGVPIRASVGESCKSLYLFKSFCHLECAYVVWLVWDNFKDLLSLLQFQHMLTDDTMCSDDPHTVFSRQPLIERGFSSIKHWLSTSSMAKARLLGCWKFITGQTENSSLQVILIILYILKKNQLNDTWLAATTWPPRLLDLRIKMEDVTNFKVWCFDQGIVSKYQSRTWMGLRLAWTHPGTGSPRYAGQLTSQVHKGVARWGCSPGETSHFNVSKVGVDPCPTNLSTVIILTASEPVARSIFK